jgi:hypothetical protein
MKKIIYVLFCTIALNMLYSCKKNNQTDYKDFLGGHEIVYTGAVKNVVIQPGNLRMGLKWKVGTDPNITKYIVYYNNGADSQIVDAATVKNDTIKTVIAGLQEYTYSFTVFSRNEKGNKSLPVNVNNAKVYGPVYHAGLINRPYNTEAPYTKNADGSVSLNFNTADTINVKTVINYTNASGVAVKKILLPDSGSITLKDLKAGTSISYQSYYIPERNALDTFAVAEVSNFPEIVSYYALCDKSLFKEVVLPTDVIAGAGTKMEALWDGSNGPQPMPNVFFSDPSNSQPVPLHFTFDLGKIYNHLSRVEETGTSTVPLNPTSFEVWGIANINNAATTLQSNDAGWPAEAKAKGWVLLQECVRTDDGQSAKKFDLLPNTPPVRYIRIRVKSVLGTTLFNMSELSFWDLQ